MAKKTKTLAKLEKELQIVFNTFIRLRDQDELCISCGLYFNVKDAGHYFPTQGYDGLRFNELNVNGECPGCNRFNEGHLIGYGENLPEKIGIEAYKELKQKAREYKMYGNKWSRSDLMEKIAYYKMKVKEFE